LVGYYALFEILMVTYGYDDPRNTLVTDTVSEIENNSDSESKRNFK